MYKPDYHVIPPMNKSWLTPWYDFLCTISGFGKRFKMKVLKLMTVKDGETIVDVGCGTGMFLELAAKKYPHVKLMGIDPDKEALVIAKSRLKKLNRPAEFHEAFAEAIPLQDVSVNICVSSLAFHHMPDLIKQKAAKEIFRILKPGGCFIIADFGKSESFLLKTLLRPFENLEYLKGNFQGLIPQFLEEAGFKNVRIIGKHFPAISIIQASK